MDLPDVQQLQAQRHDVTTLANAQLLSSESFRKSNTENLRDWRLEIERDQAKRVRSDLGCEMVMAAVCR